MHLSTSTFALATLLAAVAVAKPLRPSSEDSTQIQKRQWQSPVSSSAIYIISNDEKQNSVAAISIGRDGKLVHATVTPLGGLGAVAVNAMGKRSIPDALISQSSLTVAGRHIFAVNAGSNTVSMLSISPTDPLKLTLVGQPAAIPGTFPNTVAASVKNSLVCVGTSGSKAGISCANFDAKSGIGKMDALRPFPLNQTDPPVGPLNTVSQTFFSEDESMLLTTVKGNPAVNNTGFLSVFKTTASSCTSQQQSSGSQIALSRDETRSSPNGTAVLFGSQIIRGDGDDSRVFATDASYGAAILSLSSTTAKASLVAKQSIANQKATCWAAISPTTNSAFVTDVGTNRLIEMSLADAKILNQIDLNKYEACAADPGLIDLKVVGEFVYALSPGNGTSKPAVSVVDVRSRVLVQHATLGAVGIGATAQGMAAFTV